MSATVRTEGHQVTVPASALILLVDAAVAISRGGDRATAVTNLTALSSWVGQASSESDAHLRAKAIAGVIHGFRGDPAALAVLVDQPGRLINLVRPAYYRARRDAA